MFVPKNVYELILPLAILNWISGTAIIEYPLGYSRKVMSLVYIICCIIGYGFLLSSASNCLAEFYLTKITDSGNITFKALFYGNVFLAVCMIVFAWIRSKSTRQGIVHMGMCDQTMERIGIRKNYRKYFFYQIYYLLTLFAIVATFVCTNFVWMFAGHTPFGPKIILLIAINYPAIIMYFGVKFKQLNELLQSMLTTTPESPQHKRVLKMRDDWNKGVTSDLNQNSRTKENVDTMRAAKQIHLELVKAARNTNDIYGVQILLSMTASFVLITSLLYNAYIIIWLKLSSDEFKREIIPLCCWIFFYATKIFAINHVCARASGEAANTGDIICELYEPSTSKEFRAEIRDFTLQLIQNPLTFTASGFFNLDYTFIHGVIGSVTTYLVILIQFGDIQKPSATVNSTITNTTNLLETIN
ncbi:putative gustatory receptor 28b isoform X2 [Prorops nasuta]|uniref:putative gustatory receptor 28b isoform X2 n=1 Tax=Prorops nasuta TaxID=863751 RepID=UPI0034CE6333